jgi:hypothetical protein
MTTLTPTRDHSLAALEDHLAFGAGVIANSPRADELEAVLLEDRATVEALRCCEAPEFWGRVKSPALLFVAMPCARCGVPVKAAQGRLSIRAHGSPLCDTHLPLGPSCDPDEETP